MKGKRFLAITVGLVMLLGIAGSVFAGGGSQSAAKKSGQLHFVYVTPLLSHPVWLIAKDGFDQACKELGIQGDWVGPQIISPEEMTKLVDTAVAQKADALITQGLVPASPVQTAVEAGVPVLIVDSDLSDVDRLAFFGKDTKVQAEALYADVLAKLGPNTPLNVSIQVASLSYEVAHTQMGSIEEVFKKHPGGFKIVSTSESKSEKIQSATEWERNFNAYPEINVAINLAAEAGPACATVVNEKGIRNKVLVYAVDDIDETLDLVRSGGLDGTIVTSFFNYGYQATYWLYQHITQGKKPAKVINDAGTILVTKTNVGNYADALKKRVDL
ncbi:substrate-binding domain-containing protein [Leadbettera azotonutricia]|uniref:Periplasmic binding protein domain-containing protein n=1 Tax=Leadbettera azotonutricia (strain ATCC BAA-888 / DSM 13862 / ZAS-9) TaxID=545695 RepID=F5Y7Y6_LEAAZ|nr:substrate-binding domain-containing protein [Leadbettera azotonutricia]AEF83330.1 hypothetical protein TREAZ_2322 [Leadbettera azotonutricia ZAS-9]